MLSKEKKALLSQISCAVNGRHWAVYAGINSDKNSTNN